MHKNPISSLLEGRVSTFFELCIYFSSLLIYITLLFIRSQERVTSNFYISPGIWDRFLLYYLECKVMLYLKPFLSTVMKGCRSTHQQQQRSLRSNTRHRCCSNRPKVNPTEFGQAFFYIAMENIGNMHLRNLICLL